MNWDQIEIKWAEMTRRVRADSQTRKATAQSDPAKTPAAIAAPDAAAEDQSSSVAKPVHVE